LPAVAAAAAAMGNNLSNPLEPDTSGVVWAPYDQSSMIMLGVIWALVFYACAMIWTTLALIDRWRGRNDKIRTGKSSVFAALLLSAAWPAVLGYMRVSL